MKRKNLVVIGGGPGGYVAAIRAGQLGMDVAVVDENDSMGGVCLNWGCIPSKALIHVASLYEEMKSMEEIGLSAKNIQFDLAKIQKWKGKIVSQLTGGVGQLLKASNVEIIRARAEFETPHRLNLKTKSSSPEALDFDMAILATGSRTLEIPGFSIDGENVISSTEALDFTKLPKRMLIIGGGVIGLEIGMLYAKFGSKITVVELTDQLLPGVDEEISKAITKSCKKKDIDIFLSTKAVSYEKTKKGLSVSLQKEDEKTQVECDVILLSVGRRPNSSGIGLEKIGVRVDARGFVSVNEKMQTTLPHIFAIGDLSGPPLLAHKASKEGIVAAEVAAGHASAADYRAMPGAIFTDPEIATVGLTEKEALEKGFSIQVGRFPFVASGRALSTQSSEGFVKVISNEETKEILGVHIMGAHASDLISEAALAIEMGATVEDLALTVHPHPTLSESLMEACESALGSAIHVANRKPREKKRRDHELQ